MNGNNIKWGGVVVGVVTAIALSILTNMQKPTRAEMEQKDLLIEERLGKRLESLEKKMDDMIRLQYQLIRNGRGQ